MLKVKKLFLLLLLLIFPAGCAQKNPVDTLLVEEATIRVFFNPKPDFFERDTYKGRVPDPDKHRVVGFYVVLKNTGRDKEFLIAEAIIDPELRKYIINPEGAPPGSVRSEFPVTFQPGYRGCLRFFFIAEGNPAEIERLAAKSKVRIIWEEGGKKWSKIVPVSTKPPAEKPITAKESDAEKTLKVKEAVVRTLFNPELNSPCYNWYKGREPDPHKHRLVFFRVTIENAGENIKRNVKIEPLLEPSLQKMVVNSVEAIPDFLVMPGETETVLDSPYFLIEGNPDEIEKLAAKSKVRIVWEEGGKKWEKTVSVTLEK
ncbi:MAG: hypothetical protein PWQ91_916 [Eubacteriales bacterium]|nr:hypothetical protein [Eubacteriales bacterium]MDN5363855.1 hypothetical protein [Eubacteriales bacterium]